ncbi:UNVERIFIED_CONTAM: hypothetical protein RMT77_000613 [Armadillidium vulgare]
MFNKFIKYSKTVISPSVLNNSQFFSPLCTLFKFLNQNVYRKSLHLYKTQIHIISKRIFFVKRQVALPSLLTLSFSIPIFANKPKYDEEESEIIMILKRAILATQCGEVAKAEESLNLALKKAQETENKEAIVYIYDLMANYAFDVKDYEKAETYFVYILKLLLQNGKADDDNDVVEVSLKLARIYFLLGDNEKALQGFQFCIGTQEEKMNSLGEGNVDEDTLGLWAMSHDWFAKFLLTLPRYDCAKEHFKRACDVYSKVKGKNHPEVAVLLNDIASVCFLQQNYDEAIEYFNKAINIGILHKHESLASFYVNLGTVYLQKKAFEETELNCKMALKIAERYKSEESVNESMVCLKTLEVLKNMVVTGLDHP